ncbi:hypothetical protein JG688_00017430, partial [Phytophthora aleatoria]
MADDQEDNDMEQGFPYSRRMASPQSHLQAAIKTWVEYHWNFVQTDATGLAFLLDSHTNLNRFVGSDEGDTIKQGCAFAERSGILARKYRLPLNCAFDTPRPWCVK